MYPGTTAITVSAAVLNDLKTSGQSSFKYGVGGLKALMGMFRKLGERSQGDTSPGKAPQTGQNAQDLFSQEVICTLKRAEPSDLALPVLVNDQRVELPAVHASCKTEDSEANFYFLDDVKNPLALAWQLGEASDRLQVIKITFPQQQAAQPQPAEKHIEQQLATTGRAEVYGIYFDFASDKIRPESEPVLKEIAKC